MDLWLKNYNEWSEDGKSMVEYLHQFKNFFSNDFCCKKNKPERKILNNFTLFESCSKCNLNRNIILPKYTDLTKFRKNLVHRIQKIEGLLENLLLDINSGNILKEKNTIDNYNKLKESYKENKNLYDNLEKYRNIFNETKNEDILNLEFEIRDLYNSINLINMNFNKFKAIYLEDNDILGEIKIPSNIIHDEEKVKLFIIKKKHNKDLKNTKTLLVAKKTLIKKMLEKKEEKNTILNEKYNDYNNLLILESFKITNSNENNLNNFNKDEINIPKQILLTNNSRSNLKDIAETKGIKVGNRFGKSIDLVVVSDKDPKKKEKKAIEKGIKTVSDTDFINSFKEDNDKNVDVIEIIPKKKKIKKIDAKYKNDDNSDSNLDNNVDNSIPKQILLTDNSRTNLREIAESKGIKVGKIFGKSTDLLVVSDEDPKKKEKKAIEKGIKIIDNKSFIENYS